MTITFGSFLGWIFWGGTELCGPWSPPILACCSCCLLTTVENLSLPWSCWAAQCHSCGGLAHCPSPHEYLGHSPPFLFSPPQALPAKLNRQNNLLRRPHSKGFAHRKNFLSSSQAVTGVSKPVLVIPDLHWGYGSGDLSRALPIYWTLGHLFSSGVSCEQVSCRRAKCF